jgi:sec-independent protein translocase protein TatB
MFDIGWQELFIVAVLALIVVGPKDLPRALRTIMGLVRKARGMARDFQDGIDDVVREADLDDMKNKLENLSDSDIEKTIHDTIDPTGGLASDLDMSEIKGDIEALGNDTPDPETDAPSPSAVEETKTPEVEAAAPSRSVGEEAKTPKTKSDKDA